MPWINSARQTFNNKNIGENIFILTVQRQSSHYCVAVVATELNLLQLALCV